MAHSIQLYKNRAWRFNDIDLLIIMSLVIDEVNDHQESYQKIIGAVKEWEDCVAGYAPGVIELNLDTELHEDAVRSAFLSVLSDVRAKLASFGDSVPIEFLRRLAMFRLFGRGEVIEFFEPCPTSRLVDVVAALEELIDNSPA